MRENDLGKLPFKWHYYRRNDGRPLRNWCLGVIIIVIVIGVCNRVFDGLGWGEAFALGVFSPFRLIPLPMKDVLLPLLWPGTIVLATIAFVSHLTRPVNDYQVLMIEQENLERKFGRIISREAVRQYGREVVIPMATVMNTSKGRAKRVVVGLRDKEEGHALFVAPTGLGKGLSATEILAAWPYAALVVDPKRELYERTAGYRQQTVGGIWEVPDCGVSMKTLYDLNNDLDLQTLHSYFVNTADIRSDKAFFYTASRYIFDACVQYANAAGYDPVQTILSMQFGKMEDVLQVLQKHDPAAISQFLSGSSLLTLQQNRTAQSVWITMQNALRSYRAFIPLLCPTGKAGVDYVGSDWVAQKESIYLTWPMETLVASGTIAGAIIHGLIRQRQRQVDPNQVHKGEIAPLLIIIDELGAVQLRDLDVLLATTRGYGIHVAVYVQNLSQLYEIYGQNRAVTAMGNCAYQVFYRSHDNVTSQYMAEMYGEDAKLSVSYGQSGERERVRRRGQEKKSQNRSLHRQRSIGAEWRSGEDDDVFVQLGGKHRLLAQRCNPYASKTGKMLAGYGRIELHPVYEPGMITWHSTGQRGLSARAAVD